MLSGASLLSIVRQISRTVQQQLITGFKFYWEFAFKYRSSLFAPQKQQQPAWKMDMPSIVIRIVIAFGSLGRAATTAAANTNAFWLSPVNSLLTQIGPFCTLPYHSVVFLSSLLHISTHTHTAIASSVAFTHSEPEQEQRSKCLFLTNAPGSFLVSRSCDCKSGKNSSSSSSSSSSNRSSSCSTDDRCLPITN